jgi:hypothetical protein
MQTRVFCRRDGLKYSPAGGALLQSPLRLELEMDHGQEKAGTFYPSWHLASETKIWIASLFCPLCSRPVQAGFNLAACMPISQQTFWRREIERADSLLGICLCVDWFVSLSVLNCKLFKFYLKSNFPNFRLAATLDT